VTWRFGFSHRHRAAVEIISFLMSPRPNQNRRDIRLEAGGIALLIALATFFLAISWRKWCDPLLDFGDQLYTAWRLSEGAVLYRDVDLLYGPLSQYFNAALFRVFGPGITVLVATNISIFAVILTVLYFLSRRAWGATAAIVACGIFIAVFGFSQFAVIGNYNYATPYSHEVTHGMLVCLLLCLVLVRVVEDGTMIQSLLAGGLFGLAAVLKPEFALAGGLMTLTAALTRWRCRSRPRTLEVVAWTFGAILPSAAFAIYFSMFMPWSAAVADACRGWLNAGDASLSGDALQMSLLGFDQPWLHLRQQGFATLFASLVIGALAAVAWRAEKSARSSSVLLAGALLGGGCAWLSLSEINWIDVGRCLLGLMSIYLAVSALSILRLGKESAPDLRVSVSRLLLAMLATALMARMFLSGRIYHYGFYQAALAGTILPAVLLSELPLRLRFTQRGRAIVIIGTLALLIPAAVILTKRSQARLRSKTSLVGTGRDQFYTFPPEIDPTGEMVNVTTAALRKSPDARPLLVLPEGEMINYLARLPNPIPQCFFYAGVTAGGRERQIVKELETHPPYWVVIISRDLREYGISRYGEKAGSGEEILRWVEENYKKGASIGGDPLDYRQYGAWILRKSRYP
jgi:hypothetical protein